MQLASEVGAVCGRLLTYRWMAGGVRMEWDRWTPSCCQRAGRWCRKRHPPFALKMGKNSPQGVSLTRGPTVCHSLSFLIGSCDCSLLPILLWILSNLCFSHSPFSEFPSTRLSVYRTFLFRRPTLASNTTCQRTEIFDIDAFFSLVYLTMVLSFEVSKLRNHVSFLLANPESF